MVDHVALLRIAFVSMLVLVFGCRADTAPPAAEAPVPQPAPVAESPPAEAAEAPTALDIPNARMPAEGILTGGQPTVEHLEQAARDGYRTIVNLRPADEEGAWNEAPKAAELGMRYVAIPIASADGLTTEAARQLAEVVDDPEARPVMVHCASGNRVGALFALKAFHLEGADVESALATGREAGLTKLEGAVRERLSPE